MQLKQSIARFLSVLLIVPVLLASAVSVNAAAVEGSLTLAITGGGVEISEVQTGDIITVEVRSTPISKLGGVYFTLAYDTSAFENNSASSACLIGGSSNTPSYGYDGANGIITAVWDTNVKDGVDADGTIFTFQFTAKNTAASSQADFTLKVIEMYTSLSDGMRDVSAAGTQHKVTVTVNSQTVPAEAVAALETVKTIVYPDSLADIEAAEAAYASLTASEKKLLAAQYPELIQALNAARSTYNELEAQANEQAILDEVSGFQRDYAAVLALTAETVTLNDEVPVAAATAALSKLSKSAQSRLVTEQRLLAALSKQIAALKNAAQNEEEENASAIEDAANFKEQYSDLWSLTDEILEREYLDYADRLDEALFMYGILSQKAQALVQNEKNMLDQMLAKVDTLIEADEYAQTIRDEINAYQKSWIYVFALSEDTVTVGDKAAINLALEAMENLSAPAKERLQSRKLFMENLLSVIEQLEAETTDASGGGQVIVINPEPVTPGTADGSQNTVNDVPIPAAPVGDTANAEPQTVLKYITEKGGIHPLILWLLIILAVAILAMIYPACVLINDYKKKKSDKGGAEIC